jgi:ribosomal-protein-alanine acetyltransferase
LIVPATPLDVEAIARIEAAGAPEPWSVHAVRAALARPTTIALVVRDAERLVGHVLASAVVDEGEILTLTVDPTERRKGHARALLAAIEAVWRERGIKTAWLEVRRDNGSARALYAATGWSEHGVRVGYYGDGCDAIVLEKRL